MSIIEELKRESKSKKLDGLLNRIIIYHDVFGMFARRLNKTYYGLIIRAGTLFISRSEKRALSVDLRGFFMILIFCFVIESMGRNGVKI